MLGLLRQPASDPRFIWTEQKDKNHLCGFCLQEKWSTGVDQKHIEDWTSDRKASQTKVFQVQPKRCMVERTFSWINNDQRLSKDYERLTSLAENIIYIGMIKRIPNRLIRQKSWLLKQLLRSLPHTTSSTGGSDWESLWVVSAAFFTPMLEMVILSLSGR